MIKQDAKSADEAIQLFKDINSEPQNSPTNRYFVNLQYQIACTKRKI